jgi:xanthine dehydrogenase accessory factor
MTPYVLIWGGGDLASGAAIRLYRSGIKVLVIERSQPKAVRLSVAFARAVFDGQISIEDVPATLIQSPEEMDQCWLNKHVPVLVDPELDLLTKFPPLVLVDARMRKQQDILSLEMANLVIGLGPGFTAQVNCHVAVETNRGHFLGRVIWDGSTEADTGVPGVVLNYGLERVFFAPTDGEVFAHKTIGDWVLKGEKVMTIGGVDMEAPFDGLIRGMIHAGTIVNKGEKVGDIDPRPETYRCWTVSEKSLAIGGGVLEAVLTQEAIRRQLWAD